MYRFLQLEVIRLVQVSLHCNNAIQLALRSRADFSALLFLHCGRVQDLVIKTVSSGIWPLTTRLCPTLPSSVTSCLKKLQWEERKGERASEWEGWYLPLMFPLSDGCARTTQGFYTETWKRKSKKKQIQRAPEFHQSNDSISVNWTGLELEVSVHSIS